MNIVFIKQKARQGLYDLSAHAHQERQEEKITIEEIEKALLKGGRIEQYPKDPRGESCLIASIDSDKPLHIVCGQ